MKQLTKQLYEIDSFEDLTELIQKECFGKKQGITLVSAYEKRGVIYNIVFGIIDLSDINSIRFNQQRLVDEHIMLK